jgi:predicted DNA-binding transcriptional regulator AlpA
MVGGLLGRAARQRQIAQTALSSLLSPIRSRLYALFGPPLDFRFDPARPAVPGMQAVPLKKPGQGRPARHAQVNTSSRGEHDQQAPKPEEAGDVTLIRLPEVLAITGLKKTSIYQKMEVNRFPAQVPLGARAVDCHHAHRPAHSAQRIAQIDQANTH